MVKLSKNLGMHKPLFFSSPMVFFVFTLRMEICLLPPFAFMSPWMPIFFISFALFNCIMRPFMSFIFISIIFS